MRRILFILALYAVAAPALADDSKQFRFGLQTALNTYAIDDPVGATDRGKGLSFGGIALFSVGRDSRVMLNVNKGSYSLAASRSHVGQDVSCFGSGVSYQGMMRVSRTWKPWVGAGVDFSSTSYKNRFVFTPGGAKTLYADRNVTGVALLLNANSEWQYNHDFDIGLQAQYAKSISDKSNTLGIGIYVVY